MVDNLVEQDAAAVIRDGRAFFIEGRSGRYPRVRHAQSDGIEEGESSVSAVTADRWVEDLFVWESAIHRHPVFRVDAESAVDLGPGISE